MKISNNHKFIYSELLSIINNELYIEEYILARHITTFKTGGKIEFIVYPDNIEKLKKILSFLKEFDIKYFILGKGSNVLIKDEGYNGVIISLENMCSNITYKDELLFVGSCVTLKNLSNFCITNSLTGVEFASGIPGTIGGAIYMNAGAYDGEIKDIVTSITILDDNLDIIKLNNDELDFSYRHSIIKEKSYIVLEATFNLKKASRNDIILKVNDLTQKRVSKQPLEYPSAGSTFKRPNGYFAAKLIDDAGMRGTKLGGAMVSEKHTGFIINYNNATTADIISLINLVQKEVYNKFNVKLEREVIIL